MEAACHGVVEVFRSSSIATVRTSHITGTRFSFDVQGMKNAFVIQYKYCLSTKALILLSSESFYCFPD
jgi:hypothetical protein